MRFLVIWYYINDPEFPYTQPPDRFTVLWTVLLSFCFIEIPWHFYCAQQLQKYTTLIVDFDISPDEEEKLRESQIAAKNRPRGMSTKSEVTNQVRVDHSFKAPESYSINEINEELQKDEEFDKQSKEKSMKERKYTQQATKPSYGGLNLDYDEDKKDLLIEEEEF